MAIQRWNPFIDVRSFNRARFGAFESGRWPIPIDVVSEGEDVVVRASLPGLKPEDISVTLEDRLLTIQGETATNGEVEKGDYLLRERRVGRFSRSLRLPNSLDSEKAEPTYENGVLTISFPRQESNKARRLEVKSV
ncbi:MAG: Hsp20/alpha crystallin family protein [Dehalococcoidia bacterium]|nr:Hsp20/alpha crystallin family protein [Dehalococcoidia bacterium]